jgi:LDH2 family malate/lactate/ureidoglycolate dehydrogenase
MLVGSNLAGHDSHGILRIPMYLTQVRKGSLFPTLEPELLTERAATALLDCRRGWGHYSAAVAMELAVRKAAEAGSATVVLRNCNHIGRLGEFVEHAAQAGMIGIVIMGSGGYGHGCTAPLGGVERALGTNPYAFGVPTGITPFVLDFATTVVAEGKIQVLRAKGLPLPPGWVVDSEGRPSTDAERFYDGGSLLFAGGHKGYGLSVFATLLAATNGAFRPETWGLGGVVVQAIDPTAFLPMEEYQAHVRAFLEGMKSVRRAEGVSELLYPGEPEHRTRAERLARGVEVPQSMWDEIRQSADELGIALPDGE